MWIISGDLHLLTFYRIQRQQHLISLASNSFKVTVYQSPYYLKPDNFCFTIIKFKYTFGSDAFTYNVLTK